MEDPFDHAEDTEPVEIPSGMLSPEALRGVVEAAGLDWGAARSHLDDAGWQSMLEDNRRAMYALGLWGVPSFRLLDAQGDEQLALWGQDRLWLLSREIQRLLAATADAQS